MVPPEVALILAELKKPIRLPILLALERGPKTARQLCADLGVPMDPVQAALVRLRRSGLVAIADHNQPAHYNLRAKLYSTPYKGWAAVLDALYVLAHSVDES